MKEKKERQKKRKRRASSFLGAKTPRRILEKIVDGSKILVILKLNILS